jgi:hypothetical protein
LKDKDTDSLKYIERLYGVYGTEELIEMLEGYRFKDALLTLEKLKKELVK